MLTHVKELIQQNLNKLRGHWPEAPVGVYSAGLGSKEIAQITFAGIQSIRNRAEKLGHVDLAIVDECFVAGTKISTPGGPKDIELVRCGDLVYNQCGVGTVRAVSAKPAYEIFTLEFDDGTTTRCTGNHPFFTNDGLKIARELENGTYFFSLEGMRLLRESVYPMGKDRAEREDDFSYARKDLEQAAILLDILREEIKPKVAFQAGKTEDQPSFEGNKAQAYKEGRERAITAIASASAASCTGGRLGSGICHTYKTSAYQPELSYVLQNRLSQSEPKNWDRSRRREPRLNSTKKTRYEENRFPNFPRLVNISREQQASPRAVFNLRVDGHPSYFADGKLVHNCDLISHRDEGGYRSLISALERINPSMRVIGLTATPYRLGHGYITDKPALFESLIEPVKVQTLIHLGHLAPLRSKLTKEELDVANVAKRGGEYIESELQMAVDKADVNESIAKEILAVASFSTVKVGAAEISSVSTYKTSSSSHN
jgi:hypothetical protein